MVRLAQLSDTSELMKIIEGINFQLSIRAEHQDLPLDTYLPLITHLNQRFAELSLHSYLALNTSRDSIMLSPHATLFDHVIIHGMRYWPRSHTTSLENSLVAVRMSDLPTSLLHVGKLASIFSVNQTDIGGRHRFGCVRWLKPSTVDLRGTVWQSL